MKIKEPTGDECDENKVVYTDSNHIGYALWYPQMGGYHGKCVAVMQKQSVEYLHGSAMGTCIELYIWHDGEFPFT